MTSNLLENVQIYLLSQADSRIRDIVLIFWPQYIFSKMADVRDSKSVSTLSICKIWPVYLHSVAVIEGGKNGFMIFLNPFRSLIS